MKIGIKRFDYEKIKGKPTYFSPILGKLELKCFHEYENVIEINYYIEKSN